EDIGDVLGCDGSTISRRFSREFALGRSQCKVGIRRILYRQAVKGSTSAAIHLEARFYGPLDRAPKVDQGEVLEALSDGHDDKDLPGGQHQGEASGPPGEVT